MKVGIDSYCYHRFFGEVYDEQVKPPKEMTLEDFIKRAKELEVDGVSLESCFIPRFDSAYLSQVKGMLDEFGLDRVFAWGHPDGLEGGKNEKMFDQMIEMIAVPVERKREDGQCGRYQRQRHAARPPRSREFWLSLFGRTIFHRGAQLLTRIREIQEGNPKTWGRSELLKPSCLI